MLPILLGKKIWLSHKPELVEQEILRLTPIGSPVEATHAILEQNEFDCKYMQNETYYENRTGHEYKNLDFYSCELNKDWFLEREIWNIQLATKYGKLTRLSVSYSDVEL